MDQKTADSPEAPDGKHCPKCGKDIGVWPVMLAGLPNRIRCPNCRTRLVYRNTLAEFLVLLFIVLPLCVLASFAVVQFLNPYGTNQFDQAVAFLVLLLVAWVPVELVAAIYLRANKVLTIVEKKYEAGPMNAGFDSHDEYQVHAYLILGFWCSDCDRELPIDSAHEMPSDEWCVEVAQAARAAGWYVPADGEGRMDVETAYCDASGPSPPDTRMTLSAHVQ